MQDQINHGISPIYQPSIFQSFFQGGFDCSTETRGDGRRIDIINASGHEMLASKDYAQLAEQNITTVRDGVRWHLIEPSPGHYDWSSFLSMFHAAQANHLQIIWDLCHFGWPDHVDVWKPEFVAQFAHFAGAVAAKMRDEGVTGQYFTPINAISFLAWAGGDIAHIQPMASKQGRALKLQMVRATLAAIDAIRAVDNTARFLQPEPVVHINAPEGQPEMEVAAEALRMAQFEVWDMICGKSLPELGGRYDYLDIIGISYHPDNQWFYEGGLIPFDDTHYRPFTAILKEVYQRYHRPLLIAETGANSDLRVPWMRYIFEQCVQSMKNGVAIEGICIYPVADYRSWSGEKHLPFGLLGMQDVNGNRSLFEPLALEIHSQQIRLKSLREDGRPDPKAQPA
ncbi:beta-glucosidase [Acerihabitans sp. TG2]|uniref:beta-glucosidase n=1 Tax=Acerihabitans sp. TG2 TaxID=3096008 RepID=UPI002B23E677|nr:beta-glucosidase [Acerihabitans sp. TG2]MEA9391966.1 beta-glucosidase [Acerihabitans sp. TG2]